MSGSASWDRLSERHHTASRLIALPRAQAAGAAAIGRRLYDIRLGYAVHPFGFMMYGTASTLLWLHDLRSGYTVHPHPAAAVTAAGSPSALTCAGWRLLKML